VIRSDRAKAGALTYKAVDLVRIVRIRTDWPNREDDLIYGHKRAARDRKGWAACHWARIRPRAQTYPYGFWSGRQFG